MPILELAIPTPLRRLFDYLPPAAGGAEQLRPGQRLLVPFGNRKLVGVLLSVKQHSDFAVDQLKPALAVLDDQPLLDSTLLELLRWAAGYYHHPIGDVLSHALPTLLRKGDDLLSDTWWQLTTEGKGLPEGALKRAPKQAAVLARLQRAEAASDSDLNALAGRGPIKSLAEKKLIRAVRREAALAAPDLPETEPALPLNPQQQAAIDAVNQIAGYGCVLLDGVTGSGKTEVYLQLIAQCLERGRQALVLVPEIGLTPQTLRRFQARFTQPIAVMHSGLNDRERLLAWQSARAGTAAIVIGTRSAIFTPLAAPGLIIIDEEHDSSFKQQDGFRYSARDLGIKRARDQQCPIVLGSATPSLETLHHARQGHYRHLKLTERATGAAMPQFELLDIRHAPLDEGLSPSLLSAIGRELAQGHQVLTFINRRGYAPTLICHDCGWVAECDHCDARYTVHYKQQQLRCHHCEQQRPLPRQCLQCGSHHLDFQGPGTERIELALQRLFGRWPVLRIDRDTTSRKHAMEQLLGPVVAGDPCLMVGTQLLAKGHHFPGVTLVAVIDADSALFSADFRGPERMAQLLIQVAGRAGREQRPGKVLIQTHQPDHPLWHTLLKQGYPALADQLLDERRAQRMPPFGFLAMIRAEGSSLAQTEQLLHSLRAGSDSNDDCQALGPLPAPMTRRAGQFRSQLLLHAVERRALHRRLRHCIALAEQDPLAKKLRWSVDVDPADLY